MELVAAICALADTISGSRVDDLAVRGSTAIASGCSGVEEGYDVPRAFQVAPASVLRISCVPLFAP